tara:strand:+ start:2430 stop:2579 length:150 start_codon:yes stop_codon:yes gene_type:complete
MKYRLEFLDERARRRRIIKELNDKKHLDNFIAYIERTKNWMLDEVHKLN